ncbi:hypothetical protein JQ582_39420 [Bradyrhizobium japonicum]|uniref:hypothetical protein n=1 Tax=Bradyrhizobium japonicum TaxID=375 RepID=UPI001BA8CF80|nr:hypothetical protein [Bradyrhizobium japonicum]MBR0749998.1 hypothetical protein [Bradyrhizobium japonicum]
MQRVRLTDLTKPAQLVAIARVVIVCGQNGDHILDETQLAVATVEAIEKVVEIWDELIDRVRFFVGRWVNH